MLSASTMSDHDASTMSDERVLLTLDDDVLLAIARGLLARELPAALRLLQTCSQLLACLDAIKAEAGARRLQWQPQLSRRADIGGDGATLSKTPGAVLLQPGHPGPEQSAAWAAGGLLPTTGRFCWSVHTRLVQTNRRFLLFVGVCDAACTTAWVSAPYHGRLTRLTRSADGNFWSSASPGSVGQAPVPPPDDVTAWQARAATLWHPPPSPPPSHSGATSACHVRARVSE